MTELRPCDFYRAFVVKREPADELLTELAQARRVRVVLVEVVERVYAELVQDQDPLAIPLGLALEDYKHPFSMVENAQMSSNTPTDSTLTG